MSLHANPRSGCALCRGQVHRSRLTAVCAERNAMAHELIVGHFSVRSKWIASLEASMSVAFFSLRYFVKRNLSLALAALFVIVAASLLQAQIVETGVITGVVKDNTGAVIPGAHVAVRNTGTGLTTLTSTDAQGIYVTPPLHPGDYTVQIDVPGFSKVVESVRLEVGQRVAADANLAVGTAAETIEVQSSGELLETESSSVGNLRTEEAVRDLPLNGRNFNELFSLGAGAIPTTTQASSIPYTQQRGPSYFAINGSRPQENRTLVDGIGDQENHNSMTAIFPPIDAIQEFSEETTDADARYGRGNGGTINVVIKSGTDKYHGDVFEFLRNTALDARNYFNTTGRQSASAAKRVWRHLRRTGLLQTGQPQDLLLCRLCRKALCSGPDEH